MKSIKNVLETVVTLPLLVAQGLKQECRSPEPPTRREFLTYTFTGILGASSVLAARDYNNSQQTIHDSEKRSKFLDEQIDKVEEQTRIKIATREEQEKLEQLQLEQERLEKESLECLEQEKLEQEFKEYQDQQAELQKDWKMAKNALEAPGKIPFGYDLTVDLARLLRCEAGEFYYDPKKLGFFSSTVLRRAQIAEVPINDVIFDAKTFSNGKVVHAYSCLNSYDGNHSLFQNPLQGKNESERIINKKAWEAIYQHSGEILNTGKPLEQVDYYWTEPLALQPKWADHRKLQKTIHSNDGRKTHFYNLGKYAPAGKSPLIA
jgi:hypothetical protein